MLSRGTRRCLLFPGNVVIVYFCGEMDKIELTATTRDILGKKVRFLRRRGITPANLYGHQLKSTALQVETHDLKHALARAGMSSLISLKIDGAKRSKMVIVRDVQREPLSGDLLHVDLYQVKMEEKIKLEVPLAFFGEAPAIRDRGGILVQNLDSVDIECLPANMPHSIEVDISVLAEIDQAVHVKDLRVPEGVTVLSDPEQAVVQIARSRVEAEIAEEAAVAEAVAVEAEMAEEKAAPPEAAEGAPEPAEERRPAA